MNLSAAQLGDRGLLEHVADCLAAHDLLPSALRIEITESVLFTERDGSSSMLQQLHDLGLGLVVDDFGTGFSSLSYLHRFPLAALKIDRAFTATLGSADHHAAAIVEAIIAMATALGLETVAEGVEDDLQRAELLGLGCTFAQGWLFGKPVAPAEFEQVLQASPAPLRRQPVPARPAQFEEAASRVLLEHTIDATTGLLGRASFTRMTGGLRHDDSGRFGVVVARFRDLPAAAGQALQACLRAGDVAARWSADELVVLRHPLDDVASLEELATDITAALGPLGVKLVDCNWSSDEHPSPADLLTPFRRASGTEASDADEPRPSSPVEA